MMKPQIKQFKYVMMNIRTKKLSIKNKYKYIIEIRTK